jgi:preprotein translocase subunit YajC
MFESPAFAQATNGGTAAGGMNVGSIINMVFPLHQDMLGAVKPRDTAVTTGGLIGKVTKVDDNEVELEVAQGVRVRVVKSMLSDVRPHGAKAAND